GEGFARRFLVAPVARSDAVATDDNLAQLASGHLIAIVIDDVDAGAADRQAGRAALARADGRLHHRLAAAFGGAVDLRDAGAAQLLELLDNRLRHWRAARRADA